MACSASALCSPPSRWAQCSTDRALRVVVYTLVGTVFTVIVQGAMNVALTPFAIPTLTGPFVLASWLFLLPRQHFE